MKFHQLSLISAILASLVACGGGGGDTTSANAPAAAPARAPVVAASSTIVATVPAPTYTAASEELAAFNLLNAERERCGFGKLAQNSKLDVAAKGHADWLLVNSYAGHFQVAGTPGFTGVAAEDRVSAAGYLLGGITDENSSVTGTNDISGRSVMAVRGLLSAPYHLAGLVAGYRDIGISIRNIPLSGSAAMPRTIEQFNLAYTTTEGQQLPSADAVLTYPWPASTILAARVASQRNVTSGCCRSLRQFDPWW